MPDARSGEAVDDADAQLLGRPGGVLHLFDGAATDAVRLTVPPDMIRHDPFVPRVDIVEDALSDEVIGDRKQLQVVLLQEVAFTAAVGIVGDRLVDLEMVAPASQLEPVVTKLTGLLAQRLEGEIGPLAGKQRNGASHGDSFLR